MSAFNFIPTRFNSVDLQATLLPAEQLSLISAALPQTQTPPVAAAAAIRACVARARP